MTSLQLQEAALRKVAGSYGTTHPVYHDRASGSHSWATWMMCRRLPVPPYGSVSRPHSGQERDHISRTAHILSKQLMGYGHIGRCLESSNGLCEVSTYLSAAEAVASKKVHSNW